MLESLRETMGQNDTRCVIWALGMFFLFLHVFCTLTNDFYYIQVISMFSRYEEGWGVQ